MFLFYCFPQGSPGCPSNTQRKSVTSAKFFSKVETFHPKALPGGKSSWSSGFHLSLCFPQLFPFQLVHIGLWNKLIWVMIPVPPHLQAGKRSLLHLPFASKSPKCCRKEMSHTSSFLPSRPAPLLHHAVKIHLQERCFSPYKTRKGIIAKTFWIVL